MHATPEHSRPPYLSIVAASRNDDHGGDLVGRMQRFVDGLADQTRRYGLDIELVLVDWNPPADRPGLDAVLSWETSRAAGLDVRILRVPGDVHDRLAHAEQLPFFQMIAKNVGIRRSRGEFVLATNIDILFSEELMSWLATRPLEAGAFYRVDRFDVPTEVPEDVNTEQLSGWCADNAFRVARREGLFVRPDVRNDASFSNGDDRSRFQAIADYYRESAARPGIWPSRHAYAARAVVRKILHRLNPNRKPPLHTNACGDFTLMSRADWTRLLGYPEFEVHSWHLDGIALHQARRQGVREHCLAPPKCIFHIEHAKGSGWTPEGGEELFDKLQDAGIARLSNIDLDNLIYRIESSPPDIVFNDLQWGLDREDFEEIDPR